VYTSSLSEMIIPQSIVRFYARYPEVTPMENLAVIPKDLNDGQMVKASVVAAWFGVNVITIYAWSKNGRLPMPYRPAPRTTLYNVGQLRKAVMTSEYVSIEKE